MDGFKILDQYNIVMFKPATYFIILGIGILTVVVATIIHKKSTLKKEEYIALTCFSIFLIIITITWGIIEGKQEYKVTPIDYKYHIDTNKYHISEIEGDIWTLIER